MRNVIGYRRIYLVGHQVPSIEGTVAIEESIFPFDLSTVARAHGSGPRNGWYLQQLIKLYAGQTIPGILDRYLVIDADTFFLHQTTFECPDGRPMYNYGTEYHTPYFDHIERLIPGLARQDVSVSGICHHMMFDRSYVAEIIQTVELAHGRSFHSVFLDSVVRTEPSGASEYELYFNYMVSNHSDAIVVRRLNWANTRVIPSCDHNFSYVSCHWYMRRS